MHAHRTRRGFTIAIREDGAGSRWLLVSYRWPARVAVRVTEGPPVWVFFAAMERHARRLIAQLNAFAVALR